MSTAPDPEKSSCQTIEKPIFVSAADALILGIRIARYATLSIVVRENILTGAEWRIEVGRGREYGDLDILKFSSLLKKRRE